MRTIFDWLEFKKVGDVLSQNSDEAYVRSAITRYYYAVFSAMREYLIMVKKQYQFLSRYKVHRRVWEFLIISENDNEREIGEFLAKVRNVRNSADYDNENDYEYFVEELKNISVEIDRIVDSINYLRSNCGVL